MGIGGAVGLDYPAVLAFAALGGPLPPLAAALMAQALPEAEAALLKSFAKESDA